MNTTAALALVEVVLVFGGVLLFGWWQLRSIKKDQAKRNAQPASRGADGESGPP